MVKFPEKALAIRTCGADGTSHGGFKWPSEIGSVVTCDDWNAAAQCGNGLHALLDGFGDYTLLSSERDAIWQVVEVSRAECIELDGKVKFESCTLIYSGLMSVAMTIMADYQTALMLNLHIDDPEASGVASQLAASGKGSQLAASGYASRLAASGGASQLAASGYASRLAASGYASQLAASGGASQLAASGGGSQLAASGEGSQLAASGYTSQLAASGKGSQLAASGYASRLAASGYASQLAASGKGSQLAASGEGSQLAASGKGSQLAASGKNSISVCVGLGGSALAGEDGCIALAWWDRNKQRYRLKVGYAGEDGIEAGETYELDAYNNFIQTN